MWRAFGLGVRLLRVFVFLFLVAGVPGAFSGVLGFQNSFFLKGLRSS